MGYMIIYPLVNIQKAIENGHRNSGFSHEKWVDLSMAKVSSPEAKASDTFGAQLQNEPQFRRDVPMLRSSLHVDHHCAFSLIARSVPATRPPQTEDCDCKACTKCWWKRKIQTHRCCSKGFDGFNLSCLTPPGMKFITQIHYSSKSLS